MSGTTRTSKTLAAYVLVSTYLPLAALLAAATYFFSWRAPLALALLVTALLFRRRFLRRFPVRHGLRARKGRLAIDILALMVIGGCGGYLALTGIGYGGLGLIFGALFGVLLSFSELPLATKDEHGNLIELTSETFFDEKRSRRLNVFGYLLPAIVLAICVAVLLLDR
jgi:hypothetical protein